MAFGRQNEVFSSLLNLFLNLKLGLKCKRKNYFFGQDEGRRSVFYALLQHEAGLRSHIEEQVHDAQVWQKAVLLLEHLIVGRWGESLVGFIARLGADGLPEVVGIDRRGVHVALSRPDVGTQAEPPANQFLEGRVEVDEVSEVLTVYGQNVVGHILKKRTVFVAAFQGVPMQMAPVAVPAQPDVACRHFAFAFVHDGQCQSQRSVGAGNDAAVAVGLLDIMVVAVQNDVGRAIELGEIFDGWQIGRRKDDWAHGLGMRKMKDEESG